VVQETGSFQYQVNFSLRLTVAELRGVKVAQFSDFGLFSPYKTLKTYLPVISLQPSGYIAEWFRFFPVIVEGPKGCLPAWDISRDFWIGELGTPKLAQIFAMANGYIHTEYNCTARQIWTKDVSKRVYRQSLHSQGVSTKHRCSYPQNPPKIPFWGTVQCKTYYIERVLRKLHALVELQSLNFTFI